MSLQDVLSRDFFVEYIKNGACAVWRLLCLWLTCTPSGEVAMLSEGRVGIDNVFSLRSGTEQSPYSFPAVLCS